MCAINLFNLFVLYRKPSGRTILKFLSAYGLRVHNILCLICDKRKDSEHKQKHNQQNRTTSENKVFFFLLSQRKKKCFDSFPFRRLNRMVTEVMTKRKIDDCIKN